MWHWPWQQDPYQQDPYQQDPYQQPYFPNSAARQYPTQQVYHDEYCSPFLAEQPNNAHSVGTGSCYAAPPVHNDASAAQYYAIGKQDQTSDASGDQHEYLGGIPAISHGSLAGASEDSSLPSASGQELWLRIAELPAAMKEQMLKHAKVSERGASGTSRSRRPEHSWAFSSRLPSLEVLLPDAGAVAQELQIGSAAGALFAACSASAAACAVDTGGPAGWGAYMGLQVGGIVVGEVLVSKKSYLLIQVNEQTHVPQGLGALSRSEFHLTDAVKGICHTSDMEDADKDFLETKFPRGTRVVAVVLSVSPTHGRLKLSLKGEPAAAGLEAVRGGSGGVLPLALGRTDQMMQVASEPKMLDASLSSSHYLSLLEQDLALHSPDILSTMATAYGIDEGVSMARPGLTSAHLEDIKAYTDQTKKAVGRKWAEESTRQGIAHAKKGSYSDALKCYEQALELDPKHRDAYVARGAAYANQGNLTGACEEFRMALKIDPEHQNAAKYLAATRHKLGLNDTALPLSTAPACSPRPGDLGDTGRPRAALHPNAHPRANFSAGGAQQTEQDHNTGCRDDGTGEGLASSSDMAYEEEIQRAVADAVARERKRKRKVAKARKEKKGRKRKDKKDKKAKKRKRRRDKDAKRRRHADHGRETSFGAGRDSGSVSGSSSGDVSDSESETDDERPSRLTSSVQIEAPAQPPTPAEASTFSEAMTRKVASPIIWKVDS